MRGRDRRFEFRGIFRETLPSRRAPMRYLARVAKAVNKARTR
jgi:hypothetical protein